MIDGIAMEIEEPMQKPQKSFTGNYSFAIEQIEYMQGGIKQLISSYCMSHYCGDRNRFSAEKQPCKSFFEGRCMAHEFLKQKGY